MKKKYYNKLIRDNIPEKMDAAGAAYEVRSLDEDEFRRELLKKVGEEASALPGMSEKGEILPEIADLYATLAEIQRVWGMTDEEITQALEESNAKKGGFEKRLFLTWSEDNGYETNERRNQ